jgi:hypothetical protein
MSSKQNKLHFLLRALGFFEKTSDTDIPRKWDTSHLNNRSYFVIDYTGCEERETDTSAAGKSSTDDISQTYELFELTEKETSQHFTRIAGGDFPWSRLNHLVIEGHRDGEITENELQEWQGLHEFSEKHFQVVSDRTVEYEGFTRGALNDVLLWGIALDYRWGCEEIDGGFLHGC